MTFYVAATAPNGVLVQAEGGSLLLALENFRVLWNTNSLNEDRAPIGVFSANERMTPARFYEHFQYKPALRCLITNHALARDIFVDTALDE